MQRREDRGMRNVGKKGKSKQAAETLEIKQKIVNRYREKRGEYAKREWKAKYGR